MWTDLMLDHVLDDGMLADGFAQIFEQSPADVGVVDAILLASSIVPILVERRDLGGDFPLGVSVYLCPELQRRVSDPFDEQIAIARLCALWHCRCLFSDDDLNPYSWLLMHPSGLLEAVTVDAERLDHKDEFVIASVEGIVRHVPIPV
jgi:hypothetical protein